jgi:hypothetical protein
MWSQGQRVCWAVTLHNNFVNEESEYALSLAARRTPSFCDSLGVELVEADLEQAGFSASRR